MQMLRLSSNSTPTAGQHTCDAAANGCDADRLPAQELLQELPQAGGVALAAAGRLDELRRQAELVLHQPCYLRRLLLHTGVR